MHRCLALAICTAAIATTAVFGTAAASASEGAGTPPKCAAVVTSTPPGALNPTAAPNAPCWVEEKYPFVGEGKEVEGRKHLEPSTEPCKTAETEGRPCYLKVLSMTFKAWNEGRAVTEGPKEREGPPLVWAYNGKRWSVDPTFLAQAKNCTGTTIISAGKGDYWLVNASPKATGEPWAPLCRFDAESDEWGPVSIPATTAERLTYLGEHESIRTRSGGITSGACFAWNNCWFFGSYGVVLHWSEEPPSAGAEPLLALREAGTPYTPGLISGGEFLGAAVGQAPGGESFALAVGSNSEGTNSPSGREQVTPLQTTAGGEPPAELYSSIGGPFAPVNFIAPHLTEAEDPYDGSLVAVSVDPAGSGWVAGGSAEHRTEPPLHVGYKPQVSPLVPVTASGESICVKPPLFAFAPEGEPVSGAVPGAFWWSSIAVIPGTSEAIAGGAMRRTAGEVIAGDPSEDAQPEPVIAQVACDGTVTLTRFRTNEVLENGTVTSNPAPADREGHVTAVAASAPNDAWATTSKGDFPPDTTEGRSTPAVAPPHLYHLTDGLPPDAEAGNSLETRVKREPPVPVFHEETPPPAPAPVVLTVTTKRTIKLPPAIYGVKSSVHTSTVAGHTKIDLYLTFRLRRAVTVGARALRNGHVVSVAKATRFRGRTGKLVLSLDRAHWPTKVTFTG
jgi:hypothetical protein